jgi:hypothetical protein
MSRVTTTRERDRGTPGDLAGVLAVGSVVLLVAVRRVGCLLHSPLSPENAEAVPRF